MDQYIPIKRSIITVVIVFLAIQSYLRKFVCILPLPSLRRSMRKSMAGCLGPQPRITGTTFPSAQNIDSARFRNITSVADIPHLIPTRGVVILPKFICMSAKLSFWNISVFWRPFIPSNIYGLPTFQYLTTTLSTLFHSNLFCRPVERWRVVHPSDQGRQNRSYGWT